MLEFINKYIFGTAVPIILMGSGIFYLILLKAFHLTRPTAILKVLTKRNSKDGISPFRAVTLALAGTLGVGNIVGVSAAICLGGFGAIFWMWITAALAMLLKYAEIVLAMKYREYDKSGTPHGAAMYYIKDFFTRRSLSRIGGALAATFAFFCIINAVTMGSMIQANAISESFEGVFGISPLLCGAILTILCGIIIPRGAESMAKFTEILVPIMTLGYVIISLAVIIIKRDMLQDALRSIISDAMSGDSAVGGALGFFLSRSLRFGTMRGLISNEAGCGTAPTAHASSNSKNAVEQGFWGIFEVFTDTLLLCTMTALVVIVNFSEIRYRSSWIMLTIDAYANVLGGVASVFLAISVLCFGFATIICWAHYGIESVRYFSRGRTLKNLFIFIYCAATFIGAFAASEMIWTAADFAIGVMTLINVSVITLMSGEVKEETELYFSKKGKKQKNKKSEKIFQKTVDK